MLHTKKVLAAIVLLIIWHDMIRQCFHKWCSYKYMYISVPGPLMSIWWNSAHKKFMARNAWLAQKECLTKNYKSFIINVMILLNRNSVLKLPSCKIVWWHLHWSSRFILISKDEWDFSNQVNWQNQTLNIHRIWFAIQNDTWEYQTTKTKIYGTSTTK